MGNHDSDLVRLWSKYDAFVPAGRTGRLNSIYASPSLAGLTRWIRGNHLIGLNSPHVNLKSSQVTVENADEVYVYSIALHDKFFSFNGVTPEQAKAYWDSGIRLSDWEKVSEEMGLDASEWEVLVPADSIGSIKAISDNRILDNAPIDCIEELRKSLRDRREFLKWHDA